MAKDKLFSHRYTPGTSDEHLSLCTYLNTRNVEGLNAKSVNTSAIVVTTPSKVSIQAVRKQLDFCKKVNIPIMGIVENMSTFTCTHCEKDVQLFPCIRNSTENKSAGEALADEYNISDSWALSLLINA